MSHKIQYVLNHVFTNDFKEMVCLEKNRGPKFLIGKITVPGGKIEGDDSIEKSASKEMFEETGLQIPESDWVIFEKYEEHDYVLYKLAAFSSQCREAKTMETERVFAAYVENVLEDCQENPHKYTQDFFMNLQSSMSALALIVK